MLGLGPDATTVPQGTVRVGVGSDWGYSDARFPGTGTGSGGGSASSRTVPLGAAFSTDALGAAQLPGLAATDAAIRSLAGRGAPAISLGRIDVRQSARTQTTVFTLAAGLTRWLQLDVRVPYVRTRANVVLRGNVTGLEGNAGVNPALSDATALAADTSFAQQLVRAGAAVARYCGGAGAGTAECSGAGSLASDAQAFGAGVASVYGGGPLVPTARSAAQAAIDERGAALRARLNAFAAVSGSGVPPVTATGVTPAGPLATPELQAVLSDSTLGLGAEPFRTIEQSHLGDIEAGATIRILDSFAGSRERAVAPRGLNFRVAVGGAYRFGTGRGDSPASLVDIPTGTGTPALIAHAAADVLVGRSFWMSLVGRTTLPRADAAVVRAVPAAAPTVFAGPSSTALVERQRGRVTELTVVPRWVIGSFVSVGALFRHTSGAADRYGGGAVVPAVAGFGGASTAQQLGGGIAFSNARSVARGRGWFTVDAAYEHLETIRGANVAKLISDRFTVRLYVPVLGR